MDNMTYSDSVGQSKDLLNHLLLLNVDLHKVLENIKSHSILIP